MEHSAEALRAREFALAAHGDQMYGDRPYWVHLDAVAGLLAPFGEAAQVVGYLHDVAEDTAVALGEIRAAFGDPVAECVALVTDPPDSTRRECKLASHAKLAAVPADSPLALALVVKAADRLANLRASALGGAGAKLGMYRREHAEFRAAAFRPGLCDGLWAEINARIGGGA